MNKHYFTKESYGTYLRSGYWRTFRKSVMIAFENKCWFCESKESLQLHHTKYTEDSIESKRLVHNNLRWFLLLCEKCHSKIHTLQKEQGIDVYSATRLYRDLYFIKKRMYIWRKVAKKRLKPMGVKL